MGEKTASLQVVRNGCDKGQPFGQVALEKQKHQSGRDASAVLDSTGNLLPFLFLSLNRGASV